MTEIEAVLAEIWTKLLNTPVGSPDNDFFELGGDSLQMMSMLSEVEASLGVEITPGELFDDPSLRAVARLIEVAKSELASSER